MTLNITVISPSAIHQSADFQISKTEKDASGNWVELQPNSTKILPLRYQKWSGFVTYCGIGLWSGKRTDQYVVEWLADLAPNNATFRDVVETIRVRGSNWLGGINRGRKEKFGHSFVLAGFEAGLPMYAIVSNIQSLTEYFRSPSAELLSDVRATKDLHVFITGIPGAVPENSQSRLKALVRSGATANVIRFEMANVNRIASESSESKNGISTACLAYSIDAHGAGHGEVHGDVQGPVMPRIVLNGVDMSAKLAEVLKSIPNAKLVQAAYATTQSNQVDLQERIECRPEFKTNESCAIEEIGAINDYWMSLQAINDNEWIVGQMRNPLNTNPQAFVRIPGRGITGLGTFGGPFSHAFSVNDKNQVVGSAHLDHEVVHGYLWDESTGMLDLGTLGGIRSVARDINNYGQVVGESFVEASAPRQETERAFLWSASAGMINLGESFESWSKAVAINDHGVVIGWRQRGHSVCGFAWSQERGATDIVGPSRFYPTAINDDGLVVGEGDDTAGKRRAFTWTQEGGLKQLAVPDEFHPSDVDAYGNVLGNVYSRPWQKPGIYDTARERYLELPAAYNHQTYVKALNRSGTIIGAANTGSTKHSHALIWRLGR